MSSKIGKKPSHYFVNLLKWYIKHRLFVVRQILSLPWYCKALDQCLSTWACIHSWNAFRLFFVSSKILLIKSANSVAADALETCCFTPIWKTYKHMTLKGVFFGDAEIFKLYKHWTIRSQSDHSSCFSVQNWWRYYWRSQFIHSVYLFICRWWVVDNLDLILRHLQGSCITWEANCRYNGARQLVVLSNVVQI